MEKTFWEGNVAEIFLFPTLDTSGQSVVEAHLVPGRGIEGDRSFLQTEEVTDEMEPVYEVTLIESEAIVAVQEETRKQVDASSLWRNIVTSGFSVSHLVDREFQIGTVRLRGLALYEPSPLLMEIIGHKVAVSFMHRAGLIAEILTEGTIQVGDVIHE
jgi:hypothetical protein